ncbi:MAG TPA: Mut7-C RNAse domain-containing protein [Sphingobacteriaceae bacterium]
MRTASFRYHGRLNQLIPDASGRERTFRFFLKPSLKDAIESMGIPHVEVGAVLVNGQPGSLGDSLMPDDRVEVFPSTGGPAGGVGPRFLADNHLGKLVKELRILGLDTRYHETSDTSELIRTSLAEQRILLTRSLQVLKFGALKEGYMVRSEEPKVQVREVIGRYDLKQHFRPFTRCLVCNGVIAPVSRSDVLSEVPPLTARFFDAFFRCSSCLKVYWKGSHYTRMLEFLAQLD